MTTLEQIAQLTESLYSKLGKAKKKMFPKSKDKKKLGDQVDQMLVDTGTDIKELEALLRKKKADLNKSK